MKCPSIDTNGVLEVFRVLSGLDEFDDRVAVLCRNAGLSVSRMIQPERFTVADMSRVCYAAGCLAYYRYTLLAGESDITGFKAGDVTVKTENSATAIARELYEGAMNSIRDLFAERSFAFRRT